MISHVVWTQEQEAQLVGLFDAFLAGVAETTGHSPLSTWGRLNQILTEAEERLNQLLTEAEEERS